MISSLAVGKEGEAQRGSRVYQQPGCFRFFTIYDQLRRDMRSSENHLHRNTFECIDITWDQFIKELDCFVAIVDLHNEITEQIIADQPINLAAFGHQSS